MAEMSKLQKMEEFVADWQHLCAQSPLSIRQIVSDTVTLHAADLSHLFYSHMLENKEAKLFLDNTLVNQRLGSSMQAWLKNLFTLKNSDPTSIYQYQCHVGEVHARLNIPISLVSRGAGLLKHAIADSLVQTDLSRTDLVRATNYVSDTMELALDAMTDSFFTDTERFVRIDESYRMFSLGQNMQAERERQRAALMEWTQELLMGLLTDTEARSLTASQHSQFGMWLHHKASIVFESAPELQQIRQRVEAIESSLLHRLHDARRTQGDAKCLIKEFEAGVSEIQFLLGGLFDRFIEVESGSDPLTKLLNRRFLPSVMAREMRLARNSGKSFGLLMIDLDYFKKINDTYGHDGGDLILQQAAALISTCVRVGDFIFRFGGEEILVVLVEVEEQTASAVAEMIRKHFEEEIFRVGGDKTANVTVSIGVALYDGHPDFEIIVKNADDALYQAKESGRNRCVTYQKD